MYLMIDNYDSFVYNLYAYLRELGEEVLVVRNDRISLKEIEKLLRDGLDGILISPGPKSPADCGISCQVVERFAGRVPILGVCLGHQVIGHVYGAAVEKGTCPMHGKVSAVTNNGTGLFAGLPLAFSVTRYHSLVVSEKSFPEVLKVDARTDDGVIMAISHKTLPVYGVQFHPEAVLTEYGHELLHNFVKICEEWKTRKKKESGRNRIKKLEPYRPLAELFEIFKEEDQAVFLDSSLQNELGQFSIIGRKPYLTLRKEKKLYVNGEAADETLESFLKRYLAENREENPTALPMISGAIGYFTYDYGRRKEGISSRFPDEQELIPEAVWNFYDNYLIEDHSAKEVFLVAGGRTCPAEQGLSELEALIGAWEQGRDPLHEEQEDGIQTEGFSVEVKADSTEEEYLKAVEDMKHYIVEGDIYITNLTRQLVLKSKKEPYETFLKLRRINPSPFGGYFQYGDFQVVSASPERFLKMKKGYIETRPIKGTRKRGATKEEDEALRKELVDSGKDRSELLMIVDLERNDLSRVCEKNTVKVPELFAIEEYATVFHLVSTITGTLQKDRDVMDLIGAAFPGGSITGAPKIRSMEIIDELERGRRGLYTGSMGYLTLDGCLDLNIVIRTLVYKDGSYHLGVGGGITCESEPEFEYEETWQKARALVEALK